MKQYHDLFGPYQDIRYIYMGILPKSLINAQSLTVMHFLKTGEDNTLLRSLQNGIYVATYILK